ncbi:MAG: acetoin utilization protein AcuC [Alphaproteobacteria bacterium]|nr:acetoin utilization protein AcuC [Alphaproteobacteria bacterium]
MQTGPWFIGSEIYRRSSYGAWHPLAIPRVSTTIDLCRALGWLADGAYVESPVATPAQLARFHAPDYIAAVQMAEARQAVDEPVRRRFNLGSGGNPVFAEMFRRPATACGGSLRAAALVADGGIAYNPAGGTHHGRRARASGFCYFNDPVLGLLALLDQGLERIYYVDLDAHHGDGVQAAFAADERVLTVSVHEERRWPHSGAVDDRAGGMARNLPMPSALNDSEFHLVVEEALLPLGTGFRPQAVMIQCGADALADDPLANLALSNGALWSAVAALKCLAPRMVVLGGGGYNPWAVARCWAGVWATLAGHAVPERLPAAAEALLRGLNWNRAAGRSPPQTWFTTLADEMRPGVIRPEVRATVRQVMA